MFDEMPFLKIVAHMGLADAIYNKGKKIPKWSTKEEARFYTIGYNYGKKQLL